MLDVTSGAPLNTIINMLAPYIKVPIETATNRSMLTGAPLYSNEHEKNQKLLMNALSQLGVFRDIQNTVSPKAEEGRAVTPLLDRSVLGATQSVLKDYSPTEGYRMR